MVKVASPPASGPKQGTQTLMSWWKALEPSYKALTVILGAIGLGMALMSYMIGGKVDLNAADIRANEAAIEASDIRLRSVEACVDTIRSDLGLVRCWARHEIQGTDPKECLFRGGDNGGGG